MEDILYEVKVQQRMEGQKKKKKEKRKKKERRRRWRRRKVEEEEEKEEKKKMKKEKKKIIKDQCYRKAFTFPSFIMIYSRAFEKWRREFNYTSFYHLPFVACCNVKIPKPRLFENKREERLYNRALLSRGEALPLPYKAT